MKYWSGQSWNDCHAEPGEGSHSNITYSSYSTLAAIVIAGALLISPFSAFGQPLEILNASYASVTGSRIPLWIAKDAGLFEKYGLHVNLVVIAAGSAAIGALAGGDVEVLGAPGTTTMVSAANGLPVAIIGTFGPGSWKLVAHSGITSVQELRGKTVGISRLGTGIEFATRRALLKLGFTPGKDINILATGLAESSKRIMVMLQGKIDATLVSPDNMYEAETKGWKLSTLVVFRINMATYKSLFISDVSATVIPTEDGPDAQNKPVPNRTLETGKRSPGTPRAKIYVAVFRGLACQDDPACCRGTIQ